MADLLHIRFDNYRKNPVNPVFDRGLSWEFLLFCPTKVICQEMVEEGGYQGWVWRPGSITIAMALSLIAQNATSS